ncbi:hypothetical protein RND71_019670 [Anisodus tanguticus]|uniref:Uncharacterized protein n=1 Tax=Anisodus tanguticus TaxID=243964 RepID=A0AAE1RZF1_9SOLA|nr:hypothetical protein RND71_019670 [Anisodus tanguticus]
MGSRPQNSTCSRMRRARRKSTNQKRPKLTGTDDNNYSSISADLITNIVSERHSAQEKLSINNDDVKGDQLFEETADYIVLLRTQVFVLQKLLDLYDNNSGQSQDDNHSNNV